jgi:GNAT superfamily N-acetyltransferase
MSYERQAREWSWVIRNRAARQPVIVAADAEHGVVGFVSFGPSRLGDRPAGQPFAGRAGANVGEIYTLYVEPDFQERGIGRRLLMAAFATMIDKGYGCSFLWVLRDNPSRYFYERVGGKAVAERRERMWGCMLDQVCYSWPDLTQTINRFGSCQIR